MKTWNDALGARNNCPNFDPCPLCFGCRNYTSYVIRCQKCKEDNQKDNLCKRDFHTERALSLMLKERSKI